MKDFLRQPYPFEINVKKTFISCLLVGAFIAFFLIVFQPFHMESWKIPYKNLHLGMYGVISCFVPFLFSLLVRIIFGKIEENWLVWKQITFMVSFVFLIIISCYLYSNFISNMTFSWSSLGSFAFGATLLSLFPIAHNVTSNFKKYTKEHNQIASTINEDLNHQNTVTPNNSLVVFIAENNKDTFQFDLHTILWIGASDNYCEVHFLSDGKPKKELIRSSLSRLENQCSETSLIRCHRSRIINASLVAKISGNAQGYQVWFENEAEGVPVSRTYSASILKALKK